jgi:hypothetical protein
MSAPHADRFHPSPEMALGQAWSGRVRRYLWAPEDPAPEPDAAPGPGRPRTSALPVSWDAGDPGSAE